MKRLLRIFTALFASAASMGALAADPSSPASESHSFDESAAPFLKHHCVRCHGPDKQEADLRLDQLDSDFSQRRTAERWSEVLHRLNKGEMPPDDEPRPDAQQQEQIVAWIAGELRKATAAANNTGGRVVLRRLNRSEYNNTLRDLVGVDFAPADDFPEDPPAHGFDNIGAALNVSPLLMEKYLAAARKIVDRAIVTYERPPVNKWRMEVETAHRSNQFQGRKSAGADEMWTADPVSRGHRYLLKGGGSEVRDGFVIQKQAKDESAAGFRWFKIPAGGQYVIRIRAAARVPSRDDVVASAKRILLTHQEDQWRKRGAADVAAQREKWLRDEWPRFEKHFRTDSMYDFGPPRMKVTTDEGVIIGEIDVDAPPDAPRVYEFRHEFAAAPRDLEGVNITNNYHIPKVLENFWFQNDPDFARPELWIDWLEFEGVHFDAWPPASQQRILFDSPQRDDEPRYAREVLARFMRRAYRRPLRDGELEQMMALFETIRPHKASFEEAIKTPLVAVLSSPHFLYIVEPDDAPADADADIKADAPADAKARPLNDYEIASRLSYFLWSSMPDDELFALAAAGKLRDRDVLHAQVDRMLKDEKSQALARNFAGQWLGLREVGANPPVETLFPRYDDHLEESFIRESEAFFAEILHSDLNVMNFVKSDFVTVNERLARFYGIPGVRGDQFRRVEVPDGVRRGGLMTQGSVLTITSNGTRTSPVRRGVWILDNLLGDPPPPPPPDAGDLAPKVPGIDKATVRDRLQAHRAIPQCASCHKKIDPLGFALENYHADGGWRDKVGFGYNGRVGGNDPDVDASGELPDGRKFNGVGQLQSILLTEEDRFLHCLAEKLTIYALGRGLAYTDRPLIDELVETTKQNDFQLRAMIKGIVASDAFLTK